jgi:N-methylhydantoinase A
MAQPGASRQAEPRQSRPILCDVSGDMVDAAVFDRADLVPGDHLCGPALIVEPQTTTLVSGDFTAQVDIDGNLLLNRIEFGEAPS